MNDYNRFSICEPLDAAEVLAIVDPARHYVPTWSYPCSQLSEHVALGYRSKFMLAASGDAYLSWCFLKRWDGNLSKTKSLWRPHPGAFFSYRVRGSHE